MIDEITAPAPRFILRMFCLQRLFRKYLKNNEQIDLACEIGPGLGDSASYMLGRRLVDKWHLYESSTEAKQNLSDRFCEMPKVLIRDHFGGKDEISEKYGLVMCCEVIEHIDDDVEFLRSVFSSTETGGMFFGSVPAYQKKWQSVDKLAGHYRRYERDELSNKLSAAGFETLEIQCYGFPLINLLYPLREFYYSRQVKKNLTSNKSEATARSGVARSFSKKFNKRLVYLLTRFFSGFQSIPVFTNFGDGFVFVAKKV